MAYRYQVVDYSDPRDPFVLFETNDEDEAIEYCEQANEECYDAFVEDTQEEESMTNEKLKVYLCNAISILEENNPFKHDELWEELGMTKEEYDEIMEGN